MKHLGTVANYIWPNIGNGGCTVCCGIELALVHFRPEIVNVILPKCRIYVPGKAINVGLLDAIQVLNGRVRRIVIFVVWIMPEPEVA